MLEHHAVHNTIDNTTSTHALAFYVKCDRSTKLVQYMHMQAVTWCRLNPAHISNVLSVVNWLVGRVYMYM